MILLAIFSKLLYDIKVEKFFNWKGLKKMKKIAIVAIIILLIFGFFANISSVKAAEEVIDEKTESQLVEIKENQAKTLEDYKAKYGSDSYGVVAYILHLIQVYSIPFCFLGIAIGAIRKYVIGIRRLDTLEKGMALMVAFSVILIICQVLPLAFAVFIRFGRG